MTFIGSIPQFYQPMLAPMDPNWVLDETDQGTTVVDGRREADPRVQLEGELLSGQFADPAFGMEPQALQSLHFHRG